MTKVCTKCFEEKPIEDFPWKNNIRNKRHAVCKTCTAKRSNDWYQENKEGHIKNVRVNTKGYRLEARQYIWGYLSTHPYVDCGETDPVVLEFDHVRGNKVADVTAIVGHGYAKEKIIEEIEKCDIRCTNCHRRKTAKDRGWFSWR